MELKGMDILDVVDEWLRVNEDKSEFSIVRSFVTRYCIPYWIFKSDIFGNLEVDPARLKIEDLEDELWMSIFSVIDKNITRYVDSDDEYSAHDVIDEVRADFDMYTVCTDYTTIIKAIQKLRLEKDVPLTKKEYDEIIKIAKENDIETDGLVQEKKAL